MVSAQRDPPNIPSDGCWAGEKTGTATRSNARAEFVSFNSTAPAAAALNYFSHTDARQRNPRALTSIDKLVRSLSLSACP